MIIIYTIAVTLNFYLVHGSIRLSHRIFILMFSGNNQHVPIIGALCLTYFSCLTCSLCLSCSFCLICFRCLPCFLRLSVAADSCVDSVAKYSEINGLIPPTRKVVDSNLG